MASNSRGSRFESLCVRRVLLLAATLFLMVYLLVAHETVVTPIVLAALAIVQTYGLIQLVKASNKELSRFLDAIEVSDLSQGFSPRHGDCLFPELATSFTRVFERLSEMKMETEASYRYLHTVIRHLRVGILATTPDGHVRLANHAVLKLLNLGSLKNIDDVGAVCPELCEKLKNIEPGTGEVIPITVHSEMIQLSIRSISLRLRSERLMLISLQNISVELNEKELHAWQTLIRILTHEIKNSLTPIASLASSVEQLLQLDSLEIGDGSTNEADEVRNALRTIRKRSEGLQSFVDSYRDLTHIPNPEYLTFPVAELIDRVALLMAPRFKERGIKWSATITPQNLTIQADPRLTEQVLINLVLNSIEAVRSTERPEISLQASIEVHGRPVLSLFDNGQGIVPEAIDKIFIPFFSTRKGGTGIGLSLSRQIMRLHRGELVANSEPGQLTRFSMRF